MNKVKPGVYKDNQNRTIYINRFYDHAFIINKKDEATFNKLCNRFIIPVLVVIAFSIFKISLIYSIIAGIFSFLILMYSFHMKFLKSIPHIEISKIETKLTTISSISDNNSKNKLLLKSILFTFIAILLPLNAVVSKMNNSLMIGSSISAIIVIYFAYKHFMAYLKK